MDHKEGLPAGKNRLFLEKSPYLLQHADNPVDWRPWGDEAFREARESDRPVFLSVGYATCHWCHVMAHESFEDPGVAEILNRDFIPVKVDREERPDVDLAYMAACQALTGRGGWPLSVLLTPDRKPFFAGTYFPRQARHGMPGLLDVLSEAARVWDEDRERITDVARRLTEALAPAPEKASGEPGPAVVKKALEQLTQGFDPVHGGFGGAPKFPTPHNLVFLLSQSRRHGPGPPGPELGLMAEKTLLAIRNGGIFDQVGFGLHRYSTDAAWLVPHFEKMLYDQALSAMAYLSAHAAGLGPGHGETAREIFQYVRRKLTSPDGGFFCAEDADTQGREGSHYVWTPGEVLEVLGAGDGELFCRFFGVTERGNFEGGKSVLQVPVPLPEFAEALRMAPGDLADRLSAMRLAMLVAREEREKPLLDDKILASWNGLMIAALARGAQVLSDPVLLAGARTAADFVWERMRTGSGLLLHRFREGEAGIDGFLEDYAFLAWGMIELYEADFDPGHLERALLLTRTMLDRFLDPEEGGLFFSGTGAETPVARAKDLYDGATPSGNSVAAVNLVRLSRLTGETDLEERARDMSRAFGARVAAQPMAYTHFLSAVDLLWGPAAEVVVAGDPGDKRTREMLDVVRRSLRPGTVALLAAPDHGRLAELAPFVRDMAPGPDGPRAYVCRDRACRAPVSTARELERALGE